MTATIVLLGILAASVGLAVYSRFSARSSVEDFVVGERSFGGVLLIVLAVGEIYSIGTLIGLPGGIYSQGASYGMWFVGYTLLAYPIGYYVGPKLWSAAKRYGALTLPDIMKSHFGSRGLELTVALASLGFLIPWAQFQFAGLEVVLQATGFELSRVATVVVAVAMALVYVTISGIRSSAMVSILKDLTLLAAIGGVGIWAISVGGGPANIFDAAIERGGAVTVSGDALTYAVTTILIQAPTFYLGALGFLLVATAKSARTVQKTFIFQPLYMIMHPLLVIASFYAVGSVSVSDPDLAFLEVAKSLGSDPLLGLVAGAAALSGFLLLAVLALAVSAIFSRNIVPNLPRDKQKRWVTLTIAIFLIISAVLAVTGQSLMLDILTFAYLISAQIMPSTVAVLFRVRIAPTALSIGLIAGLGCAVAMQASGHTQVHGVNSGLIALAVNVLVALISTWLVPCRDDRSVTASRGSSRMRST